MPNTIPNILITGGADAVDLYAHSTIVAAGVTSADQLEVRVLNDTVLYGYTGPNPAGGLGDLTGYEIITRYEAASNDANDTTYWVWSQVDTVINVRVVV